MFAPDMKKRGTRRAQNGLSIIEVMVGMVVSLLVGLAATGTAAMFTASQRQGVGTGGTLVNATTALNAMRDDAAMAGLGFFGDSKYLCSRLNLSVNAGVISDGANFSPLLITTETSTDRLDVVYATQVASGANVLLKTQSTGTGAELRSLLPASEGQAVLLAPATPGDPCVVRSVTGTTPSTSETAQQLAFANSGKYNQASFTTNVTYTANAYPDIGRIALLGDLRWTRYRREGTDLRLERPLGGDPVILVRNVMAFRVQYGIAAAAAGSTSLETWQDATGGFAAVDATTLPRVRAVRIAVVTRSPQAEKPDASTGQCEASPNKPRDPFNPAVEITPDVTDWKCYRYRTSVVVVPLRNLVMGMAS